MEISRFRESGALSTRGMAESLVLHAIVLALLLLGASVLVRNGAPRTKKEIDIVFYRPAAVPVTPPAVPPPPSKGTMRNRNRRPLKLQTGLGNRTSQQVRKRAFPRRRSRPSLTSVRPA